MSLCDMLLAAKQRMGYKQANTDKNKTNIYLPGIGYFFFAIAKSGNG